MTAAKRTPAREAPAREAPAREADRESAPRRRGRPAGTKAGTAETRDRILATAVNAQWRHMQVTDGTDWDMSYDGTRAALLDAFVGTYSYSLQQTLYAMGRTALERRPELAEVRLSLPNKHHFLVDLEPYGLDNPDEVYVATDRPYGLIEGIVRREGAPEAGMAWEDTW